MHTQDTNSTKVCTKCRRNLPITMFCRHRRLRDGRDTQCRDCKTAAQRTRRTEHKRIYTCASCGGPRLSRRSTLCRPCADTASRGRPRPKAPRNCPAVHRHTPLRVLIDNGDGTYSVPLTQGQLARIDSADVPIIEGRSWCANQSGSTFYAMANLNGKGVLMHRLIVDARPGEITDHMNGDGLDNRRCNLRICTNSQNMANRTGLPSNNKTGYLGVYPYKKTTRFFARVNHGKSAFFSKSFPTAEEAARERDRMAKEIFGEFARLNFPDGDGG